jgi:hypothetical protein
MTIKTEVAVEEDGVLSEVVEPNESVCVIEEASMAVITYTEADENGTLTLEPHLAGVEVRLVGA